MIRIETFLILSTFAATAIGAGAIEGVRRVTLLNYPDCIDLSNAATRVVLGHQTGGRVLKYEWSGEDALYLDPEEANWKSGAKSESIPISAGRFDIGPEFLVPPRPRLWSGPWTAEVIGSRTARLTSSIDPATGVRLIREFRLDEESSHLECKQIIPGGCCRICFQRARNSSTCGRSKQS